MFYDNDYEMYLPEAVELVAAWELPEADFAKAVNDQAKLMAGINLESACDLLEARTFSSLQF